MFLSKKPPPLLIQIFHPTCRWMMNSCACCHRPSENFLQKLCTRRILARSYHCPSWVILWEQECFWSSSYDASGLLWLRWLLVLIRTGKPLHGIFYTATSNYTLNWETDRIQHRINKMLFQIQRSTSKASRVSCLVLQHPGTLYG